MEEASKSLASFRASRPEDILATELSHHPQHCLNLLQRAQKSIHSLLAETGEQTIPCTQASPAVVGPSCSSLSAQRQLEAELEWEQGAHPEPQTTRALPPAKLP